MDTATNFFSKVSESLGINPATLSGAIDIVVVRHPHNSRPRCESNQTIESSDDTDTTNDEWYYVSTPFHVRFGKLQILRSKEAHVSISVNDESVDLNMKLGSAGEAYFAVPTRHESFDISLLTSPVRSSDNSSNGNSIILHQPSDASATLLLPPEFHLSGTAYDDTEIVAETEAETRVISDPKLVQHITDKSQSPLGTASRPEKSVVVSSTIDEKSDNMLWWTWDWGSVPERGDNNFALSRANSSSQLGLFENAIDKDRIQEILDAEQYQLRDLAPSEAQSRFSWLMSLFTLFRDKKQEEDSESVKAYFSREELAKLQKAQERLSMQMELQKQHQSTVDGDDTLASTSNSIAPDDINTSTVSASESQTEVMDSDSIRAASVSTPVSASLSPHKADSASPQHRNSATLSESALARLADDTTMSADNPSFDTPKFRLFGSRLGALTSDAAYDFDDNTRENSPIGSIASIPSLPSTVEFMPTSETTLLSVDNSQNTLMPNRFELDGGSTVGTDDDTAFTDTNAALTDDDTMSARRSKIIFGNGTPALGKVQMSLCADRLGHSSESNQKAFNDNLVTYEQLCADPSLVFDPKLIILNQNRLYPIAVAFPLLISFLAFRQPLSEAALKQLAMEPKFKHLQHKKPRLSKDDSDTERESDDEEKSSVPLSGNDSSPIDTLTDQKEATDVTATTATAVAVADETGAIPSPKVADTELELDPSERSASDYNWFWWFSSSTGGAHSKSRTRKGKNRKKRSKKGISIVVTSPMQKTSNVDDIRATVLEPQQLQRQQRNEDEEREEGDVEEHGYEQEQEHEEAVSSEEEHKKATIVDVSDGDDEAGYTTGDGGDVKAKRKKGTIRFKKSLRPTSEMLRAMPLKWGKNKIVFTVHTSLQGKQSIEASIFLWNHDSRIVVSDVDGTITKSDVMGHVAPWIIGNQWSHSSVAHLFTNIVKNGFVMLYLTSRSIGQASSTRSYLFSSVKQHSTNQKQLHSLPDGPVIMSPESLIRSFHREVVQRRPQDFKIPALSDVKGLFGQDHNPFFGAFGNRVTDLFSYLAVDIPRQRIFIIDSSGVIHTENSFFGTTYADLNAIVDNVFVPIKNTALTVTFNEFMYWKQEASHLNLPDLSDDD